MYRYLSDELTFLNIVNYGDWDDASEHSLSIELLEKYDQSINWEIQSCRTLPLSNKGLIKFWDRIWFDLYLEIDDNRVNQMSLNAAEIVLENYVELYLNGDIDFHTSSVLAILSRYKSEKIESLVYAKLCDYKFIKEYENIDRRNKLVPNKIILSDYSYSNLINNPWYSFNKDEFENFIEKGEFF